MTRPLFEPPGILGSNGILIAFEGIDGAGKTTQAKAVADAMDRVGFDVVVEKEPTDGPWGQKIRRAGVRMSLDEELRAFVEDRREHVELVIKPALASGKVVILDRYYFSTAAYQGARGKSYEEILSMNESFAPQPDFLALLNIDSKAAMARVRGRATPDSLFEREELLSVSAAIFSKIDRPYKHEFDACMPEAMLTASILEQLYVGLLFDRLCFKRDYKSECEPAFCSYRVDGKCRWVRIGGTAFATSQTKDRATFMETSWLLCLAWRSLG